MRKREIVLTVAACVLGAALLVSVGFNIYGALFPFESYLQTTDEIYTMEAGILKNNLEFAVGEEYEFNYDFAHEDLAVLGEKYKLAQKAGAGSEFERALRLMHEYAPRLTHESYYDNHVPMNALDLLAYSLNNKKQGINCRAKAQILNEACLSLGIYARKVWIMPNSPYDNDCHVVNEIWDTTLNKWVMLDITNDEYWVDENGTPLSVLEIRTKAALCEFCTPVGKGDKLDNLKKLKGKHIDTFLYIVKNMVYTEYCNDYTVGEQKVQYLLFPKNMETKYEKLVSQSAVERCPIK